jgi:hypothetical protein
VSRPGLYLLFGNPRLRIALSLLCLLACTWQSFVAQTHFHAHTMAFAADVCASHLSHHASSVQSAQPDDSCNSSDGDSNSCPLCVVLHAAASALPAHTWDLGPLLRIGGVHATTPAVLPTITAVSFDWSSRGPPLT